MHATPETVTHRCLLATVALYVSGADGVLHPATAVLDSGSSINLIERSFARRLGLPQHAITAHIQCVDGARVKPHGSIQLAIESMVTSWKTNVQALVVDSITHELPATSFSTANWNIPKGMPLADPRFSHSKPVDLLLGAELFYSCLQAGKVPLGDGLPSMFNSNFGWFIAGPIIASDPLVSRNFSAFLSEPISEHALERFWQPESVADCNPRTAEELKYKVHYVQNNTRNANGRYVVRLPRKNNPPPLGRTRPQAERRFASLERRLSRDPVLAEMVDRLSAEYTTTPKVAISKAKHRRRDACASS